MSVIATSAQEREVFETVVETVRKVVVHRMPLALVAGGLGVAEAELARALVHHLSTWTTRVELSASATADLAACLEPPG